VIASALSVLALAAVGCASADGGPSPNGFHRVSGDERAPPRRLPNVFISPAGEPFRAEDGHPYPVAIWFQAADANHDGKLSLAEFQSDALAFFRQLDVNHDGVVDGFEVQRYERDVAPEINPPVEGLRFGEGMDLGLGVPGSSRDRRLDQGQASSRQPQAGDRRPEGAGLYGLLNEPEPVASTDLRFDSHITAEEFTDAAARRFAKLDVHGLGYLTLATLPKTPVQTALEKQARRRRAAPPPGAAAP
jgi:hypothetical protein